MSSKNKTTAPEATLQGVDGVGAASEESQSLVITGTDLDGELRVELITPAGMVLQVAPKDTWNVSPTSVHVIAVLSIAGAWLVQVFKKDDLAGSNAVKFDVPEPTVEADASA